MIVNGRKMPVCTDTTDFTKDSDTDVGYVYKWTYKGPVDKVKEKYYIGRRLKRGNIENYNHSGTHNQFNHYFNLPESKFNYEIVYSSDEWKKVVNKETELLDKCVGNSNCWNLQKSYKTIEENDKALEELYDRLDKSMIRKFGKDGSVSYDGYYEVEYMKPTLLKQTPFYQTRDTEYIPKSVRKIKRKINDAASIVNTNPIITLQDRDPSDLLEHTGGDLNIDGNNTLRGIVKSDYDTKVKRILIPYDDHKHLSDLDIEALTGYLNSPNDPIFQEPNNEQKGIDYVLDEHLSGNKYSSKRVKERLLKMGFDSDEVNSIIRQVKDEIAKIHFNRNQNKVLIPYGDERSVDMENLIIKRFMKIHHTIDNGGTKMAKVIRSGNPILDRFLLEIVEQELEWTEMGDDRQYVTNYTIGITHTDSFLKKDWDENSKKRSKFERIQEHLEDRGYKVKIHYKEIQPVFRQKTKKIL